MTIRLGLRDWGAAEVFAGVAAVLGSVPQARAEAAVRQWFADAFRRSVFVVNSGSSALRLALEQLAAERPERHEVVLPALACPAVTREVIASGLTPIYADIADDLNTPVTSVRIRLNDRTLALVMVHAYGHPADTVGLGALCQAHGVALIDDAAQRIDPASGLGTAGDFGIFSFAQSKSVVAGIDGSGGVLLVNAPHRLPAIERRHRVLAMAQGRTAAWIEFLLWQPLPKAAYYLSRWRHHHVPATAGSPARIAAVDAAIAQVQLASLAERRRRRIEQLGSYRRVLHGMGIATPQSLGASPPSYLSRLMIRLPAERRQACQDALAAQGIASRLPYRLPVGVTEHTYPQACRIADELLELPLPSGLSADDIDRIARTVAPFGHRAQSTARMLACCTTGN